MKEEVDLTYRRPGIFGRVCLFPEQHKIFFAIKAKCPCCNLVEKRELVDKLFDFRAKREDISK